MSRLARRHASGIRHEAGLSGQGLGRPLGVGHTSEIYAWGDGHVLKLFRAWFPRSAIEHEAYVARVVHEAGLPTPAVVGDVIQVNGRYGLVYERVTGVSMLEAMTARPWALWRFARLLANLQAAIHRIADVPGLPSQHDKLRRKIESAGLLPSEVRTRALRLLESLPQGRQLCHGDFHPDNVLLTERGPVIIDWIDAANGNPLGDVARSSLLMNEAHLPEDKRMRWALNLFRSWFHRVYLNHTFRLCPGDPKALEAWRIVNAAARLSEGIPEAQALLAYLEKRLPPS